MPSVVGMFLLKQQSHNYSLHPCFWSLSIWKETKKDLRPLFLSFSTLLPIFLLPDVFTHWVTAKLGKHLCLWSRCTRAAPSTDHSTVALNWAEEKSSRVLHSTRGLKPTWRLDQLFIRLAFTYSSIVSLIITEVPKMMALCVLWFCQPFVGWCALRKASPLSWYRVYL